MTTEPTPSLASAALAFKRSAFRNGWTTFNVREEHADEAERRLLATPPAVMPAAPSDAVTLTAEHRELIDAVMRDTATSVEYRLERIFKVLALRQTMEPQADWNDGRIAGLREAAAIILKHEGETQTRERILNFISLIDAAPGAAIAAREQAGLTRDTIQKKALEHGFEYWRASDAHGVTGTRSRAIELLQDLIGVEVEIEDNGCSTCDGTGMIGGPSYYSPDEGGVPCPDCASREPFQQRVQPWLVACFGEMIAGDREERNHRFLEEALELVQACGCTRSEAHQLVDYVFSRAVGEKSQEVGGVMVTLAALCLAQDLDMAAAGETELARIWTKVEQIRTKQAAKPKHSPLPVAPEPDDAPLETGEGDAR